MKSVFTYFSFSKFNAIIVAPIFYHAHGINWLTDFANTIAHLNTVQSVFFYSFILLIMSYICKNSLLSLLREKLFFFVKSNNKIEILKNSILNLNPFYFFFKINIFTFIKNKYNI